MVNAFATPVDGCVGIRAPNFVFIEDNEINATPEGSELNRYKGRLVVFAARMIYLVFLPESAETIPPWPKY